MPDLAVSRDELGDLADALLGEGKGLRFCARGASMRPFIRDGDVLDVRPVGARRLRRGDVVLFRDREGRLLAHRVVRVGRQEGRIELFTRGDALAGWDNPVCREQILGDVVAIERGKQRIAMDTPTQRCIGLLHAAVLLARRQVSRVRRVWGA